MIKNKKFLYSGLAICFILLIVGACYWNSQNDIVGDDDIVFIGTPPTMFNMITPDRDGKVDVPWYQVDNAISYDLYRNLDGGTYELIAQLDHNPSRVFLYFSDTDFLVDGQYGYKVKAIYINGESDFSDAEIIDVFVN